MEGSGESSIGDRVSPFENRYRSAGVRSRGVTCHLAGRFVWG